MDEFPEVVVKNIFIPFDLESYLESQSEHFMKDLFTCLPVCHFMWNYLEI